MDKSFKIWSLKKTIRMEDVIANVPYAKTMLQKKMHRQVGEKIFKAFKNSLIIHSFLHNKKTGGPNTTNNLSAVYS